MIVRLILFLIFVYFGIKTILTVVRYVKNTRREKPAVNSARPASINEMIQDPVCGIYITREEAITHKTQGGTKYFCSEACKKKFLDKGHHE